MISRAHLKYLRSLARKKVRLDEGRLLVEGLRIVEEAVAHGGAEEIYLAESLDSPALDSSGIDIQRIGEADVSALSETRSPAGAFAVVRDPVVAFTDASWGERATLLVADGVADPGNLGTLIRSAAALGCDAVVVTDGTVEPTNPKVVRSTAGAIFRLPVHRGSREEIAAAGFSIWIADARGEAIDRAASRPGRLALLVGNEPRGVDAAAGEHAARTVAVPLHGGVESLNVAIAAGILLDAIRRLPVESS